MYCDTWNAHRWTKSRKGMDVAPSINVSRLGFHVFDHVGWGCVICGWVSGEGTMVSLESACWLWDRAVCACNVPDIHPLMSLHSSGHELTFNGLLINGRFVALIWMAVAMTTPHLLSAFPLSPHQLLTLMLFIVSWWSRCHLLCVLSLCASFFESLSVDTTQTQNLGRNVLWDCMSDSCVGT